MAEQEEPVRRRVALKVIKLGMDTKQVVARFEAERQALALMDHPNIAKVFDAGTIGGPDSQLSTFDYQLPQGRPYFVMELVRGVKITEFCDEHKLSTRERLSLFIQVCQAIQHAHQKGVIHRDIKPSNILVSVNDGVAVPKVIDFGIAKATQGRLTDQTLFTAFEQFIGTPAYMSPEQALMTSLDVDTRTDTYSLGVLLYELLTGRTPFDAKELVAAGIEEMRRTIREVEPVRPSTKLTETLVAAAAARRGSLGGVGQAIGADSRRQLRELIALVRGDLDWIVMKCLEKDRGRRYETVNGLARDVERYLADEPVLARPPSQVYRFRKLVRRNKGAFAAVGALALMLILGVVASTWQAIRARHAEREQERLRLQAVGEKKLAQSAAAKSQQVAAFLKDMLQGVGPSVALGRDTTMLKDILDRTTRRVSTDLTNQPEVAVELYLTLAETYWDLGLYKEMAGAAREALRVARSGLGEENESVANSLTTLGYALKFLGMKNLASLEEAEKCSRQGLAMLRKLLGNDNLKVANALYRLGSVVAARGRLEEADSIGREVLGMYRRILGNECPEVAELLENMSVGLQQLGRRAEAETMNREALAMQRKLLSPDHPELAKSLFNLANVLYYEGKLDEAGADYREALGIWRKLQANDRMELADTLNNLGYILTQQGKLAEAEILEREAVAMSRRVFGDEHFEVARPLNNLATALHEQRKAAEAEAAFRELLALQRKLAETDPSALAWTLCRLAESLQQQARLEDAEATAREALAAYRKVVGDADPSLGPPLDLLAGILIAQHKDQEVERVFADLLRPGPERQPANVAVLRARASFFARRGRWKEAAEDLSKVAGTGEADDYEQFKLTVLHLEIGDMAAYRTQCQRMVALYAATNDPGPLDKTAKVCLLAPETGCDLATAGRMADRAVTLGKDHAWIHYFELVKGLAEYRAGKFASAADWLSKTIDQPTTVGGTGPDWNRDAAAYSVLAMAQHQLERPGEAREALAKAAEIADTKLPKIESAGLLDNWADWLIARILLREAQTLVGGQPVAERQ
jgi:serine/threonine protein kinase/tetratricopeptide (TPR) repeat protein